MYTNFWGVLWTMDIEKSDKWYKEKQRKVKIDTSNKWFDTVLVVFSNIY